MISIEKIDAVIAATGSDYASVRQALLATDGDVAAAIRAILNERRDRHREGDAAFKASGANTSEADNQEEKRSEQNESRENAEGNFKYQDQIDDIIQVIKDIWRSGNASSLIVEKNGQTILNLSLTVSAFIFILTPLITVIGLGAAIITEYTIKIQMVNGEVIDVIEYTLKHGGKYNHYE